MILQRVRLISQQRVDLPDALNLEAFGNSDVSELVETFLVGDGGAYIVRGFVIESPSQYIATKTSSIPIKCADSMVFHPTSVGGAGAFFSSTNALAAQSVTLTANATNYIELDQSTSTGASDTRSFWDEEGGPDGEGQAFTQQTDTVTFLNVTITVNTVGFTATKVPICKIVVASDGTITSITDSRNLFFRLGSGGTTPNPTNTYAWPGGRTDHDVTMDNVADSNPFTGTDKDITNLKTWMNAVMTSLREVKGTSNWFSSLSGGTGSLTEIFLDSAAHVFKPETATTKWAWDGSALTWDGYIDVQNVMSPYYFRIPANNVTLTADQVAYIPQIRNEPIPSAIALAWTNGATYVNGAVGSFTGLVSDVSATRGDWIKKTSDGQDFYVRITQFYDGPNGTGTAGVAAAAAASCTIHAAYRGTTGSDDSKDVYAKGFYNLTVKSLTDSTLTFDTDKFWVAFRYSDKVITRDASAAHHSGSDRIVNDPAVYSAVPSGALAAPNFQGVSGESVVSRVSKLTGLAADASQDKNIILVRKVPATLKTNFTWDGTHLLWEELYLSMPGDDELRNKIANQTSSSAGLTDLADGQCIHVTINRAAGANVTLTVTKGTTASLDPLTQNDQVFIIARRIGTKIYTIDSEVLWDTRQFDGLMLTGKTGMAQILELGSALLSSIADRNIPRYKQTFVADSSVYTNIFELKANSATEHSVRAYTFWDGSSTFLQVTVNAFVNGSGTWDADNTAEPAMRMRISNRGVVFDVKTDTSVAWGDWSSTDSTTAGRWAHLLRDVSTFPQMSLTNGKFFISGATTGAGGSNATDGGGNALQAKNIPKAWAKVACATTTPVIGDSHGIASVAYSGNLLRLTLNQAFANDEFCVTVSLSPSTDGGALSDTVIWVSGTTTTTIDITAYDISAGAVLNLNGTDFRVHVMAHGTV